MIRTTRTTCPFCGVGCGMALGVEDGRVIDVRPLRFLADPERLTTPLVRRGGRLEPVAWKTALEAAVAALGTAQQEGGRDAVGIIASARATNEDNFAAMKFARAVLGTNNIDHCARVCHSPSVEELKRTLGSGAMTNPIADLERADCVLVVGSDTWRSSAT